MGSLQHHVRTRQVRLFEAHSLDLPVQGQECVEEDGPPIQTGCGRYFPCLPSRCEARQYRHRPGDESEIYSGSMKDDWELLAPQEIKDPEDKKPADWVNTAMMADPEDKKPDDWVEEKRIVDTEAKKPEDWDDEEDGEWEAPMKDNPDFKGEWSVKKISNPDYKGIWEAKKIANPDFVDDDSVYKYEDFSFIGFDLWQVKGGTIFDNIIITDDVAEADAFVAKWKALREVEKQKKKEADEEKAAAAKNAAEADDDDDDDDDEDEEAAKEEM